jgi:putative ABC transport system permease protein
MLYALQGAVESGVIFAFMALGVYLTFRILDFPDLTVDGSFTTGASVAAVLIFNGANPILASIAALLAGAIAGMITGLIHTKCKINPLLSGIIMMIALYSINLRIMGRPNIALLGKENNLILYLSHWLPGTLSAFSLLVALAILVFLTKWVLDWFLNSELGLALRATGDNPKMIRSLGVYTDQTKILGLSLSNGLVGLAGALFAQYQGSSDAAMGIGMIVIGLASVIIGESIFGTRSIRWTTTAVVLGAIVYRIVIALALRIPGFQASDLRLITAIIVLIALTTPLFMKRERGRRLA